MLPTKKVVFTSRRLKFSLEMKTKDIKRMTQQVVSNVFVTCNDDSAIECPSLYAKLVDGFNEKLMNPRRYLHRRKIKPTDTKISKHQTVTSSTPEPSDWKELFNNRKAKLLQLYSKWR